MSTTDLDHLDHVGRPSVLPVDAKALGVRSIDIMGTGDLADFEAVVHADAVNREAVTEPPASRGRGPAAFFATAQWLREAFADLTWDIHEVVVDGDLVAIHATMSGRQVGPFAIYDPQGDIAMELPPTDRPFAVTQSHWLRVQDGQVIEH